MYKTVTKTYTTCECDVCGKNIPLDDCLEEEYTCYCCGRHICKSCRKNFVSKEGKTKTITLCGNCEKRIYQVFKNAENE